MRNPVKKRSEWYCHAYDPLHVFIRQAVQEYQYTQERLKDYKIRLLHNQGSPSERKQMEEFVKSFQYAHKPYLVHTGKGSVGILYPTAIPGTSRVRYIVKAKLFAEGEE